MRLILLLFSFASLNATVSFFANYTLWLALEDGLAVAISNNYLLTSPKPIPGKVFYPTSHPRSGFQVGMIRHFSNSEFFSQYTCFYNQGNPLKQMKFDEDHGIGILASPPIPLYQGKSSWDLWFNRIDTIWISHLSTLASPFIGVVIAWDQQKLAVQYKEWLDQDPVNLLFREQWWAVGPYVGFKCSHQWPSHWALFLDSGCSFALSEFTTPQRSFQDLSAMIDLSFGARYTRNNIRIELGWSEQLWFNHNYLYDQQRPGNLSLQGLTLKWVVAY